MSGEVHVQAPCRLHFGMFSFGRADRAQFGGVGVMVEPPNVEVRFSTAEQFEVAGNLGDRAERFVERAIQNWNVEKLPNCRIEVDSPADHTGLGVGTQLGLAVAAGLRRFLELPTLTVEAVAESVGRGRRSAVGTYGFQQGGLIVDAGKAAPASLAKMHARVEIPDNWRFVLIQPTSTKGLAGEHETETFAALPPVPDQVTRELWRITNEEMLPAVERNDCASFGEAVYQFGRLAGECFASAQGGPFANQQIADLVAAIRASGVAGVGQSSWGPTVFAIVESQAAADVLVKQLQADAVFGRYAMSVGRANNSGARIMA
jgi:beta-RFAP synthase